MQQRSSKYKLGVLVDGLMEQEAAAKKAKADEEASNKADKKKERDARQKEEASKKEAVKAKAKSAAEKAEAEKFERTLKAKLFASVNRSYKEIQENPNHPQSKNLSILEDNLLRELTGNIPETKHQSSTAVSTQALTNYLSETVQPIFKVNQKLSGLDRKKIKEELPVMTQIWENNKSVQAANELPNRIGWELKVAELKENVTNMITVFLSQERQYQNNLVKLFKAKLQLEKHDNLPNEISKINQELIELRKNVSSLSVDEKAKREKEIRMFEAKKLSLEQEADPLNRAILERKIAEIELQLKHYKQPDYSQLAGLQQLAEEGQRVLANIIKTRELFENQLESISEHEKIFVLDLIANIKECEETLAERMFVLNGRIDKIDLIEIKEDDSRAQRVSHKPLTPFLYQELVLPHLESQVAEAENRLEKIDKLTTWLETKSHVDNAKLEKATKNYKILRDLFAQLKIVEQAILHSLGLNDGLVLAALNNYNVLLNRIMYLGDVEVDEVRVIQDAKTESKYPSSIPVSVVLAQSDSGDEKKSLDAAGPKNDESEARDMSAPAALWLVPYLSSPPSKQKEIIRDVEASLKKIATINVIANVAIQKVDSDPKYENSTVEEKISAIIADPDNKVLQLNNKEGKAAIRNSFAGHFFHPNAQAINFEDLGHLISKMNPRASDVASKRVRFSFSKSKSRLFERPQVSSQHGSAAIHEPHIALKTGYANGHAEAKKIKDIEDPKLLEIYRIGYELGKTKLPLPHALLQLANQEGYNAGYDGHEDSSPFLKNFTEKGESLFKTYKKEFDREYAQGKQDKADTKPRKVFEPAKVMLRSKSVGNIKRPITASPSIRVSLAPTGSPTVTRLSNSRSRVRDASPTPAMSSVLELPGSVNSLSSGAKSKRSTWGPESPVKGTSPSLWPNKNKISSIVTETDSIEDDQKKDKNISNSPNKSTQ